VGGKVVRGWLGVYVEQVSDELALRQGLNEPRGAMIAGIIENGPAAAAGLKPGDIIVELDRRPVAASQQLPLIVGSVPIGRTVVLKIIRHKAARLVRVTVAASREEKLASIAHAEAGSTALGLSLEDLTPELARELNLFDSRGVVVSAVTPGGSAAAAGLKPRDIILEINRHAVKDASSCEDALKAAHQGRIVLLLVRRDRATLFIPLKHQG
jgi:serine protease Do